MPNKTPDKLHFHLWAAGALAMLAAFAGVYYAEAVRMDNLLGSVPPLRRPLADIPLDLGSWTGVENQLDDNIEQVLSATDYVNRAYTHADTDRRLEVQINYGHPRPMSGHRPGVCMTGQGWHRTKVKAIDIALPAKPTQGAAQDNGQSPATDGGAPASEPATIVIPARLQGFEHPAGRQTLIVNYFIVSGGLERTYEKALDLAHGVSRQNYVAQVIVYLPWTDAPQATQTAAALLTHLHPEVMACLPASNDTNEEDATQAP